MRAFFLLSMSFVLTASGQATQPLNLATKISSASINDMVADNLRQSLIRLPGYHSREKRQPDDPEFSPQEECSINITSLVLRSSGTVESQNYPNNYKSDATCEWNLESEPGTVIEATIFDFMTQPWFWTYFDYVMISDTGDWDDYYYRFSGDLNKVMPYTIVSKSNRLSVRFVTSYFLNFRGFKMGYVVRPEYDNSTQAVGSSLAADCSYDPLPLADQVSSVIRPAAPQGGLWSSSRVRSSMERGNSAQKIAGLAKVIPHQYPFVAALLVDDKYFCGGSLIGKQHVLTAAHCLEGAENVQVFLGSHDLTIEESTRQHQTVNLSEVFINPNYDNETGAHDIAIIRLNEEVTYNSYVQPVYLPAAESMANTFEGYNVTTVGWGEWVKRTDHPRISATLRKTSSTVIPNRICEESYGDLVTGNIMCTVGSRAESTCNGDSGSPLVAAFDPSMTGNSTTTDVCYYPESDSNKDSTGKPWYVQLGVLSFGTRSCGSSSPVAYTRVTAYLSFINSVLNEA